MAQEYLSTLLQTGKYQADKQLLLKERVFITFDSLLRYAGLGGLKPGQKLLDLGSADGALVVVSRRRGLDAHGLDVADNVDFESDRLPHGDGVFDVVTAVSLIEHLRSPTCMLREALRVLKPGGVLILVTPNWRFSYKRFFDDPTHVHPYSDTSIGFLLRSVGFGKILVVPWLVCKPSWLWSVPLTFHIARMLPFRWSESKMIPNVLMGKSKSILALAVKPA